MVVVNRVWKRPYFSSKTYLAVFQRMSCPVLQGVSTQQLLAAETCDDCYRFAPSFLYEGLYRVLKTAFCLAVCAIAAVAASRSNGLAKK